MNQDATIAGEGASPPWEPAWERRMEIGFFRSIFLTIRGVLFRPSEIFSRFRWHGGYRDPILLNLLAAGITVASVLFFPIGSLLLNGSDFKLALMSSGLALLVLPLGLGVEIAFLFLFSVVVQIGLKVLRGGSVPYQGVFRAVAYTSVLIGILQAALGLAVCAFMPRALWDPMQSIVEVLLMIWQGYCIAVGLSKAAGAPIWKPPMAVAITMVLAYGAAEITSIKNPVGSRIWNGIYHAVTGSNLAS